jgi:hypothetical protein
MCVKITFIVDLPKNKTQQLETYNNEIKTMSRHSKKYCDKEKQSWVCIESKGFLCDMFI